TQAQGGARESYRKVSMHDRNSARSDDITYAPMWTPPRQFTISRTTPTMTSGGTMSGLVERPRPLLRGHAAVQGKDGAGGEATFVARQKEDSGRDLLGGAQPAEELARRYGVSIVPGAIALQWMPSPTWSMAIARVSAATAPFEAQ